LSVFRSIGLVLCGALFTALSGPALADEPNFIELRAATTIVTPTYELSDIADLTNVDPAFERRLSDIIIGRTPRPGQQANITRFELDALLEQKYPGISKRLLWRGPTFARVRGAGVRCDGNTIGQAAYRFLLERLKRTHDKVTVRMVTPPTPLIVPRGKLSFHPKLSAASRLNKRMPVWVDVCVDGEHFQTVPIWFSVSVYETGLVMKGAKKKGQHLSKRDVAQRKLDIAAMKGIPLQKPQVEGMRATRDLSAGTALTVDDVEKVPSVTRGDLITVYARNGAVLLAVRGIAMMDGCVAQRIEVRNPSSGKSYYALVIGKNLAKVN
jgi:flagella basal body P-ring formation protein FlgA